MDLLSYVAIGGLERVTIVIGAVVIGYWGYRLYAGGKNAGLVFMGLSVVVLVGALATGSTHVESLGEGYQLATTPAPPPAGTATSVEAVPTPEPELTQPPAPEEPSASRSPRPPSSAEPAALAAANGAARAPQGTAPTDEAPPGAEIDEPVPTEVVAGVVPSVRIATGQELGGRIVSVKSKNVTLEWSNDAN